jgi:hypothetical protein
LYRDDAKSIEITAFANWPHGIRRAAMTIAGSHVHDVRAVGSKAIDRFAGISGPLTRQCRIKRVFVVPTSFNQLINVVTSILPPEKD